MNQLGLADCGGAIDRAAWLARDAKSQCRARPTSELKPPGHSAAPIRFVWLLSGRRLARTGSPQIHPSIQIEHERVHGSQPASQPAANRCSGRLVRVPQFSPRNRLDWRHGDCDIWRCPWRPPNVGDGNAEPRGLARPVDPRATGNGPDNGRECSAQWLIGRSAPHDRVAKQNSTRVNTPIGGQEVAAWPNKWCSCAPLASCLLPRGDNWRCRLAKVGGARRV